MLSQGGWGAANLCHRFRASGGPPKRVLVHSRLDVADQLREDRVAFRLEVALKLRSVYPLISE